MFVDRLSQLTLSRLAVVGQDASVQDAALALSRPGIGLVVVCGPRGGLQGVLSKSDLVRHLGRSGVSSPPATALMSTSVVTCGPRENLHDVWQTMAARNLQNLPVIDEAARPLGILDIRDAMKALFDEEELKERLLLNYVTGVGYR
jgi:CBS domain-containing protein